MKIMHVVAPGEVGGLERVVQMLAVGQRSAGDDVHVAAVIPEGCSDHRSTFFRHLEAAHVASHPVRVGGRNYLRERRAIGALCREVKPDVVHLHGYRPDVVDAPVARANGVATVSTVHGFTGGGLRNRFYEWLQRRAIRRCDAVVAVARSLMGTLIRDGMPVERVHLVVNAWRPAVIPLDRSVARRVLGAAGRTFTIGWVGRLSAEKGLDVLLHALPTLAPIPYRLHVVGDGNERHALQRLAAELGVADRIAWHGVIRNAERLYKGFDAFALTSRTEGSPIVLFEAMAASVPIVATLVGGVPQIVSDREALLIPPEDPLALAMALQDTYTQPLAAERRGAAARRRLLDEYHERDWVNAYRVVYAAAADASASRT